MTIEDNAPTAGEYREWEEECEELADDVAEVLMPSIERRAREALGPDSAPRHPALEPLREHQILRLLAAFLTERADVEFIRDTFLRQAVRVGDQWEVTVEGEPMLLMDDDDLISYQCCFIAGQIALAWVMQLDDFAADLGEEDGHYGLIEPVMLDDAMLPQDTDVFVAKLEGFGFDPAVAREVLRETRSSLRKGKVLPDLLAETYMDDAKNVLQ